MYDFRHNIIISLIATIELCIELCYGNFRKSIRCEETLDDVMTSKIVILKRRRDILRVHHTK